MVGLVVFQPNFLQQNTSSFIDDDEGEDGAGPTGDYDDEDEDEEGSEGGEVGLSYLMKERIQVRQVKCLSCFIQNVIMFYFRRLESALNLKNLNPPPHRTKKMMMTTQRRRKKVRTRIVVLTCH